MPEDQAEISSFGIGVKVFQKPDGDIDYQHYIMNNETPPEIVIMQIKSILQQLEKEYFDRFNKPFS